MTGWKRLSRYALAVGCLLLVSACGASASVSVGNDASAGSGEPDPELAATLLSDEFTSLFGESIDFAALAGEDVVFWFWAPW